MMWVVHLNLQSITKLTEILNIKNKKNKSLRKYIFNLNNRNGGFKNHKV